MKHTQGPWKTFQQDDQIFIESEDRIEAISTIDGIENEDIANAKLIAAAPDLLKSLEMIVETLEAGALTKEDKIEVKEGLTRCGVYAALNKAKL